MPHPKAYPKYLASKRTAIKKEKPLKIPKNVISKDFFSRCRLDRLACVMLMIFKDKTGNTQGMKFKIKPPRMARKIKPKFKDCVSVSKRDAAEAFSVSL